MTLKPRTVIALAGAISVLVAVELIQGQDAVKSGPDAMKDLTFEEHRRYTQWWDEGRSTLFNLQSSEPQAVAYALTDSPVGWLACLIERFQDLTDNDRNFLHAVDGDAFLTDVTRRTVDYFLPSSSEEEAHIKERRIRVPKDSQDDHISNIRAGCAAEYRVPDSSARDQWADC